jgi:hypothetical protein
VKFNNFKFVWLLPCVIGCIVNLNEKQESQTHELKDKTIVLTGGGSGIGAACGSAVYQGSTTRHIDVPILICGAQNFAAEFEMCRDRD